MTTIDFHREASRLVLAFGDGAAEEVTRRVAAAEQDRAIEEAFYWSAVREAVVDLEEHRRLQFRDHRSGVMPQAASAPTPGVVDDENAVSQVG